MPRGAHHKAARLTVTFGDRDVNFAVIVVAVDVYQVKISNP
jgi:hypothetical protein